MDIGATVVGIDDDESGMKSFISLTSGDGEALGVKYRNDDDDDDVATEEEEEDVDADDDE